jgi:hypothetical protein
MSKAYRERQHRKKSIIRKILKILIPTITILYLTASGLQIFIDNDLVLYGRSGNALDFPGASGKVMFAVFVVFALIINLLVYNDDNKYDGLLQGLGVLAVAIVIFAVMLAMCYTFKR